MSEPQKLNESSSPDPNRSDPTNTEIEALLRSLVPRQPAIDRDVLFFQAGMAAANRLRTQGWLARTVWPAVAATLLVGCGGLTVALAQKSTALDAALAAARPKAADAVVSDGASVGQGGPGNRSEGLTVASVPPASVPTAMTDPRRFGSLITSRGIDRLLSQERSPQYQLTAHGWVEAPPGSAAAEFDSTPAPETPATRPTRLPTYLELLRSGRG